MCTPTFLLFTFSLFLTLSVSAPLSSPSPSAPASPSPSPSPSPPPSFSTNLLSSLFPPSAISTTPYVSRLLPDGTLALAGVIIYPSDEPPHPSFADASSIAFLYEPSYSARPAAFVARVSTAGDLLWALRLAPVPEGGKVAMEVDSNGTIFVAGGTPGLFDDGHTTPPGPFVAAVGMDGVPGPVAVHEAVAEEYVAIGWHAERKDELLLLGKAGKSAAIFEDVELKPHKGGLCVARVTREELNVKEVKPLSAGKGLVQDNFRSMAVSHDGSTLYIGVKRQVVYNGVLSSAPTVLAVATDTLQMSSEPRSLPKDLQKIMIVKGDKRGLYVGYVSRIDNKEFLIVRRLGKGLEDRSWDGASGPLFEREIKMDFQNTRNTRSDVWDMLVDDNGNVRVLLHTAEVVDTLDPEFEKHRKLSNGRPALVVITRQKIVSHIVQSVNAEQWKPYSILDGADKLYVVGSDEGELGSALDGFPRPLLTTVEHDVLPSPSPVSTASPSPGSNPIGGGDRTDAEQRMCVGASTTIEGRSFSKTVQADGRLRLQRHPIRMLRRWVGLESDGRVPMLCMSWQNGTEVANSLCATSRHVVRWHGNAMFMEDLCGAIGGCMTRLDTPVNFKGGCGADVEAHEFLGVTMHAGTRAAASADDVVREECAQRDTRRVRWLVSTL